MEPKKNSQNLLMIMMLTLLVFYTWSAFQAWMNPQKPKDAKQADPAKVAAEAKKGEPEKAAPKKNLPPVVAKLPTGPAEPHKQIIIGDDTSYIQAELSSKGAGVRRLTLNY